MRTGLYGTLLLGLASLAACGHGAVTTAGRMPNRVQVAMDVADKPQLIASVTAHLAPETRVGLALRVDRPRYVTWDARAGVPSQASVWRWDLAQSYVAHQSHPWMLRIGAWPHARARFQTDTWVASHSAASQLERTPWGLLLAYKPSSGASARPDVALWWGQAQRSVPPGQWAWQGDGWQPPIACNSKRDCPGARICTAQHRCVASHGLSEGHGPLERFALEDGLHITSLRLAVQQRLGQGALRLRIEAERRRLLALREAQATLMAHGRALGPVQNVLHAVVEAQWGAPTRALHTAKAPSAAADGLACALDRCDAFVAIHKAPRGALSFARAALLCRSGDASGLRLDMQQAIGWHRLGAGAHVRLSAMPMPMRRLAPVSLMPTHAWYVQGEAALTRRTRLWLASHRADRPGDATPMQIELGWRRDARNARGWGAQVHARRNVFAAQDRSAPAWHTHWQLAGGLRLRNDAALRAGVGMDLRNHTWRALSGHVQWRRVDGSVQLQASGRWTSNATPTRLRWAVRYAAARWLASAEVATTLAAPGHPPSARIFASASLTW